MPAPFGVGASDFIAAINLIRKIFLALKDAGGAAAEFQYLHRELQQLQILLEQLRDLPISSSKYQNHYNAVRGMAHEIQIPLYAFIKKIGPYHDKLGVNSDRSFWRSSKRKIEWALSMQEDILEMRRAITMKIVTVSLLLSMPVGWVQHQLMLFRGDSF
jgi:hypothetical protein